MKKSFYILLTILFIVLTAVALSTKRPPFTSVRIENKSITIAIQQGENDLRNTIKLRNDFSQEKKITTSETTKSIEETTVTKKHTFQLNPNKKSRLKGKRAIKRIVQKKTEQTQEKIAQNQELQKPQEQIKKEVKKEQEYVEEPQQVPDIESDDEDRFGYKSVSWNIWRSNFVNQIVDDLGLLQDIDNYPEGTWLYYSFDVDRMGNISNVKVFSPIINKQDKQIIANMFKKYAHKKITKFPKNSKRTKTTVNGIVMISYFASRYTSPDDFSDVENVRYRY